MIDLPRTLLQRTERELVTWLFHDWFVTAGAIRFVIDQALPHSTHGWTVEAWLNLPRQFLGLDPAEKPGDIDILLIPRIAEDRFAERACVIEVKKAIVKQANKGKTPNSHGQTQVQGLVRDGFPFVGLLYLLFLEDSPANEWYWAPLRQEGVHRIDEDPIIGHCRIDPARFELWSRYSRRMEVLEIPSIVGTNFQVYQVDDLGQQVIGKSESGSRRPTKNPEVDHALLDRLRRLEIPPDVRVVMHYGGIEFRWRDSFTEPSPRDE